jgi:hypothetical protein
VEEVGGSGGDVGRLGRPWRRFRLREPEVRDGPDRWDPPVGGSGGRRGEETVGGGQVDFERERAERAEGGGRPERERKEGLGRKGPKERKEDFNCFLFILIDTMIFVLLKLFLELRKITEKFRRVH